MVSADIFSFLMEQLNSLVQNDIVEAYPPLVDKKGSYTAQYEHVSCNLYWYEQIDIVG